MKYLKMMIKGKRFEMRGTSIGEVMISGLVSKSTKWSVYYTTYTFLCCSPLVKDHAYRNRKSYGILPRINLKTTIAQLAIFFVFSSIWATTYYVDASNGNDLNSGSSESSAWQTIYKVNVSNFINGDLILFKRGETWREQLDVPSSGGLENPIVFGAYGTGDNPSIIGSDLIAGWTQESVNIWKATCNIQPYIVAIDENVGSNKNSLENLSTNNDWCWVAGVLYLYDSAGNPDTEHKNPGIEAGSRNTCINISSKNYIVINGLETAHANGEWSQNISVNGTGDTIKNCLVRDGSHRGLCFDASADSCTADSLEAYGNGAGCKAAGWVIAQPQITLEASCSNIIISNCEVHDCGAWAHGIGGGGTNITITNCNVYNNPPVISGGSGFHNIYMSNGTNVTVEYCELYGSKDGVGMKVMPSSATVRYNYIHDNYEGGIKIENQAAGGAVNVYYNIFDGQSRAIHINDFNFHESTDVNIYNNVFYNDAPPNSIRALIENEVDVYELNIKNNIFYSDSTSSGWYLIQSISQSNMHCDYNCFYGGATSSPFYYNGANRTFAQWKTATGGDANSINQEPLFKDALINDFTLTDSSACIDSGTYVSLSQDHAGILVPQRYGVDIGAYEYYTNEEDTLPPDSPINLRIYKLPFKK
jgi:hypothetical protein